MNLKSVLLVSAIGVAGASHAVSLAVYNFNDSASPTTPQLFAVDRLGANVASSAITSTFASANVTSFGGSTVGADSGDASGQALALQPGTSFVNNGANIQFSLNAASGYGLSLSSLTYATQRTATGFTSQTFSYSLNGGATFLPLTAVTSLPTAFALQTIDLSAIPTSSSVLVRVVFDGGTNATGNNRLDNVVFSGSTIAQATPEPASIAALGIGALALLRRRRAK